MSWRRSSSIFRLMVLIVVTGLGLALLRAQVGEEWAIGELTPLSLMGLVGFGLGLWFQGCVRRFFWVFGFSGVVVGLAFWVGPHSFREVVLNRVILPLDALLTPKLAGCSMTGLQGSLILWVMETPETRRIRPTRSPFWSRESQEELGLLELAVAVSIGLIASIAWPIRRG
jgi:hypothetical protein